MDVRSELLAHRDEKYAMFSGSLIRGEANVLGVRLPVLRDMAKRIAKEDWRAYLESWHCEYMEDIMLRGFVISYAKMDLDERLRHFADHVELIDNWSTCDSFCTTWKPKKDEKDALWDFILPYMDSGEEFKMRFAVVMMLAHFMDEKHVGRIIDSIDRHYNEGYYYKMGVAWVLSVCFVKFPERTMRYLEGDNTLDDWTYNKTLQKIIESYRVSDETKERIRGMRRIKI